MGNRHLINRLLSCALAGCLLVVSARTGSPSDRGEFREQLRPLAQWIRDVVVDDRHEHEIALGEFTPSPDLRKTNIRLKIVTDLKFLLEKEFKIQVLASGAPLNVFGHYAYADATGDQDFKVIKVTAEITDSKTDRPIGRKGNNVVPGDTSSASPRSDAEKVSPDTQPHKRPVEQPPPDDKQKTQAKNPVEINSTKAIAMATGATGSVPAEKNGTQVGQAERNAQLQKLIAKPNVFLDGTRIRSHQEGPYAIELRVRKPLNPHPNPERIEDYGEAVQCTPQAKEGLAFVTIAENELYEIWLYNDSTEDVAVALSIDGLDDFHFSDDRKPNGQPTYAYWIVHHKGAIYDGRSTYDGSLRIVGWHKSVKGTKNFLSFMVTDLGKGAVAQSGLKAQGDVGVIHAQFSKCWPKGQRPPGRGGGTFATGFGPPQKVEQNPVEYDFDVPSDFISVRYTQPTLPDEPGGPKLPQ